MLQLKNATPFAVGFAVFPNEKGVDTLYMTVKATFKIGTELEIAEKQQPLVLADEFWGEPGLSSLKYASESHLSKPSTDVVLVGEAASTGRCPVTQLDVTLAVAGVRKIVRVFGDREWKGGVFGTGMTSPIPFESMPLVYERAFGGVYEDLDKNEVLFEARNPVGRGFKGKRRSKYLVGMPLPNLEDPAHLISDPKDQPPLAGFGFIAPSWEPRKSFAGTYDDAWQKKRAPYLPMDFCNRFFNAAHPDLVCNGYLKGGEQVEVVNASSEGPLRFKLPLCLLEAVVRIAGKDEMPPLNMETVLIEPGESRLCIAWRGAVECDKKVLKVEQIELSLQELEHVRKAA